MLTLGDMQAFNFIPDLADYQAESDRVDLMTTREDLRRKGLELRDMVASDWVSVNKEKP